MQGWTMVTFMSLHSGPMKHLSLKKVKSLEAALKRKSKRVILSDSEDEETENQGRKIQDIDDDPLVSLVRNSMEEKEADFVTPKKVSASGEAQEEDISPTTFEAAKTLSKVASQNVSTYKRRARSASKGKDIGIGMDFFSATKERLNSAKVEVNSGSAGVNTGKEKVTMTFRRCSCYSKRQKEQISQKKLVLAESYELQALKDEENARTKVP
ncbi:hypothetical protein Tco_0482515 [Tanacetum coccineum]